MISFRIVLISILVCLFTQASSQNAKAIVLVEFNEPDKFLRENVNSIELKGDSICEKNCSPIYDTYDSCFRYDPYKIKIVGDTVFVHIEWVGGDKIPYAILRKGESLRTFNLEEFVSPNDFPRRPFLRRSATYLGRKNFKSGGCKIACYRIRFNSTSYANPESAYEVLYSVDGFLPLQYVYYKADKPKKVFYKSAARRVVYGK